MTLFETTNFDERIAAFMELKKDKKGYWEHPCEFAICQSLAFKNDWQWLMPVVEKIQMNYSFEVSFKEFDQFQSGYSSSIIIFGETWVHYHWARYETLKAEIDECTEKAARYGEIYESEHHKFVDSKFQAVYLCVCRFIEWWEKQRK
jgi:hypothetical protein